MATVASSSLSVNAERDVGWFASETSVARLECDISGATPEWAFEDVVRSTRIVHDLCRGPRWQGGGANTVGFGRHYPGHPLLLGDSRRVDWQKVRAEAFHCFGADAADLAEVVERLEGAVPLAVTDDATGCCFADVGQGGEFRPVGGVDVDFELRAEGIDVVDFDQATAPPAVGQPVPGERRQAEGDERGDGGLVRATQKALGGRGFRGRGGGHRIVRVSGFWISWGFTAFDPSHPNGIGQRKTYPNAERISTN